MEQLLERLYQQISSKVYGKYRGTVVDREDPEHKGRLKLLVPAVLGNQESGWAMPCFMNGGSDNVGAFTVPEVDAHVWVEFEAGDPSSPIWTGTFFGEADAIPDEAQLTPPDARVVKTPKGSVFVISDEEGSESILLQHTSGAKLEMDANGNLKIQNSGSEVLTLDAESSVVRCEDNSGNSIEMSSAGIVIEDMAGCKITLDGGAVKIEANAEVTLDAPMINLGGAGGEGVIKGQSFLSMYAGHTHPTGVGPSGPPIPMGEMSTLSFKVKST